MLTARYYVLKETISCRVVTLMHECMAEAVTTPFVCITLRMYYVVCYSRNTYTCKYTPSVIIERSTHRASTPKPRAWASECTAKSYR